MKLETDVDQLQIQKAKIEQLLESQKLKINSKFDAELESQFWKDREDRLIKMIVRAIRPAIIIFIIFELISLPLNYLTTTPEHRFHDVGLTMISYSAAWVALFTIFAMAKKPAWNQYYAKVVATIICFVLTIVQSVLLSTHALSMTWRGSLIIALGIMFAYLCSGLRPRVTCIAAMTAGVLTSIFLVLTQVDLPIWVVTNTLILSNLVGLALATLTISTERIRFLQSIIIDYDKQIYSKLNQHFILLSHQDTLTLLGNRRGFEQQLKECIEHTKQTNSPFAILFIDVDYFKLYNDLYGHDHGDNALIRVAQTLLRHIDDGDAAIRYGGEEFVVLIRDTTRHEAETIAKDILDDVRNQKIEHKNSSIAEYLTVSIGLTLYNGEEDVTYPEILKLADQALYLAKNEGRDRYQILKINSTSDLYR